MTATGGLMDNRKIEEEAHYGGLIMGLEKVMEKGFAHVNAQRSSGYVYVVEQYRKPWQTPDKIL